MSESETSKTPVPHPEPAPPHAELAPPQAEPAPPQPGALLSWPPPGLTRMQGDLWTVSRKLFVGSVILVAPLLIVLMRTAAPIGTAPLGEGWWVLVATSLLGFGVLLEAFVDAFRLMRRFAEAVEAGYGARLVALVAADLERDAGFLIQGARTYARARDSERSALRVARVVAPVLYGVAALWLLGGFSLGVLLAARGALSQAGLAWFVLLPAGVLGLVGFLVAGWAARVRRGLRRAWHLNASSSQLDGLDANEWRTRARVDIQPRLPVSGDPARARGFRVAAALVVVAGLLISLPLWPLVATAGVGPALATVPAPSLSKIQQRFAAAESLRRHRPETDSTIPALEAGHILHVLLAVGVTASAEPPVSQPVRSYPQPWTPGEDDGNPTGVSSAMWARDLMPVHAAMGEAGRTWLAAVAEHPAQAEFSRLAHAGALDVMGARFGEIPDDVSLWELPLPRVGALREAAYAHVGLAIHQLQQGQPAEAERSIREVLGVGFLLADHGPTLLDNLIGTALLTIGADALEGLYRATGRDDVAEQLAAERATAARAAERMVAIIPAHEGAGASLAAIRDMPRIVLDSTALTGLRWESLLHVNTVAPCIDLSRAVFGPSESYENFLERARAGLVRYPADARLFEMGRAGYFGTGASGRSPSWPTRLLTFAMGGRGRPGSCAGFVEAAETAF